MSLTWNMGGHLPTDLKGLLLNEAKHDVYVIATQECMRPIGKSFFKPSKKKWVGLLSKELGEDFELLNSRALMGSHLCVFT